MSPADHALIEALGQDRDALEAFYRRHIGRVTRFAARRCRRPEDVADVVANTFLAVLERAHTYDRGRGEPVPWLLGIASREVLRVQRRDARDRALGDRIAGAALMSEDDYARIEAQIDAERLAPALERVLAAMPRSERELLLLVASDGLTPREAARALGISAVAARARLSRARRRLRDASPDDPIPLPIAQEA